MYIHIGITYIHIYIYRLGHIPPAFCDISKSHELKQFRVMGFGYMSLGFRLPNFPISQIGLGHLGWDYLGNWEIGKYIPLQISQFPNFPNRAEPDGLRSFGKLGNWEICTSSPISQIVLAHLGWDCLGNWEIGKYIPLQISQFPNFPNRAGPSGLGLFGKLGNWEIYTSSPISQIVLAHLGWDYLGNWEIGKYIPLQISQFPKSC